MSDTIMPPNGINATRIKKLIVGIAIMLYCSILPFLATSCVPTPTPGPPPTVTPVPTCAPLPTAREVTMWPTCTMIPTPEPLAMVIQDACLRANGQPIVLQRSGPIWRQAQQMYEGCPLGPQITVVAMSGTYHAQRFMFGYLFYRDSAPDEMYYMTHLGWEIHAIVPCANYLTTPVAMGTELPVLMRK